MKNIVKTIIEKIKKHDNIFVFTYFFIMLSVYIYAVTLEINDELWNFSFVYKMANGYMIYKDLNVIITPLFHYICKMIFLIFGSNYIIFRIYNIIIYSTLYTVIYIMLKKLKIKRENAFFIILILNFFIGKLVIAGANYNILAIIFVICGICLEIDNKKTVKENIEKGIIIFLIFMSKQNIAILYSLAMIISYFIKIKQKEIKIKELIKNFTIIVISFITPVMIFMIYLLINNSLYDFISYCFLGIREFAQYNRGIDYKGIIFVVLGITGISISIIFFKIKQINNDVKKINLYILPFEICMLCMSFPIFNEYHTCLGALIAIVFLFYNVNYIIFIEMFKEKDFNKFFKICIFVINIYNIIYNSYYLYEYININNSDQTICTIKPYKYIMAQDKLITKINKICEYIEKNEREGSDIKIISREADLYMNVFNKNNKNMDLPFLGNLGEKGKEGLIKEIDSLKKGTKILISKEKFWQESEDIKNKVENEYKKIDELEDFYIYEK